MFVISTNASNPNVLIPYQFPPSLLLTIVTEEKSPSVSQPGRRNSGKYSFSVILMLCLNSVRSGSFVELNPSQDQITSVSVTTSLISVSIFCLTYPIYPSMPAGVYVEKVRYGFPFPYVPSSHRPCP